MRSILHSFLFQNPAFATCLLIRLARRDSVWPMECSMPSSTRYWRFCAPAHPPSSFTVNWLKSVTLASVCASPPSRLRSLSVLPDPRR